MGSSGAEHIVARIIQAFDGQPIAPVAPLMKKLQLDPPPNVIVTDWLPADKVNAMADVTVIHGGIGTVMTACLSGTPVVSDAISTAWCAKALGCGCASNDLRQRK